MQYVIGTRGSKLAIAQAEIVQHKLQAVWPEHTFVIRIISTRGDKIKDRPLAEIGGKGIFVREIENLLLAGEIHIAVHSLKDMPAVPAKGLMFTRCMEREDARDVLILREKSSLEELPEGARIGTGSIRRKVQLLRLRPDLRICDIRGNVETRLQRMEEELFDGIVLAAAGLHRLGMQDKITQYFSYEQMIPSPAQGVLGIEIREGEEGTRRLFDSLYDTESDNTTFVEREFLRMSGGDCHLPVGAVCERVERGYRLRAMKGNADGSGLLYADVCAETIDFLAPKALAQMQPEKKTGTVYLVGAGPGDPGLFTLRGMELLKRADCVIYDRLIPMELLDSTKVDCEKIYVGKSSHNHRMEQQEIQNLLIEKARKYSDGNASHVVRLKGGDPYVFGRGGEEAAALWEAGVRCEVVPGVTSVVSGPASAGIPVTYRGISRGFRVVTAHDSSDQLAEIDFASMAKGNETCIFLMGLAHLEGIVSGLLQAGMSGNTEIAVISRAWMDGQKTCIGVLSDITERVRDEKLPTPAVIVVGSVVGMCKRMPQRRENRKRILVPKIGREQSLLTRLLEEKNIRAEEIQVGEIDFIPVHLTKESLKQPDWLVFTSRYGVRGFMKELFGLGLDARSLFGSQIAVVGKKTAGELKRYGLTADFIPSVADSETLFTELSEKMDRDAVVWYMCCESGKSGSRDKPPVGRWFEKTVYRNREVAVTLSESLERYDTAVFTCGSFAERLVKGLSNGIPDQWQKNGVYSIGPACTKKLRKLGFTNIIQASGAGYEELADKVDECIHKWKL